MGNGRVSRPALAELGRNTGKKARLHRILYQHGLRNGTAMFLPYDQGLEHGPRDFFDNPAAGDPAYIVRLAVEGGSTASPSRSAAPRSSTGTTPARCR
jgi:class I fructose-bisphosphate aldolase